MRIFGLPKEDGAHYVTRDCDFLMSPALEPRKEDSWIVGVPELEASSTAPVVFTYGLYQQAHKLVACESFHNQHSCEQNRMA
jgi:hypothetical protein